MAEVGKNVAVLTAGVVGTGDHGQGVPALVDCLRELAVDNKLTVYSLLKANKGYVPEGIRMRELPYRSRFHRINLFLLSMMLVVDHVKNRYGLIHAIAGYPFGSMGVLLGKLLGIPCLVVLHGGELANLPDLSFGDLRNRSWARKLARTCERADALVTLSRFQAMGLSEVGVSPDKSVVISFGINTTQFPYLKKSLRAPYVFLHVSYAQPVKDAETLLKTFRTISESADAELIIVGQNHIGQQTENLIEEYSLQRKVTLIGSVPNQEIAKYMQQVNFLLHTSRYESQGVVFNEAMASGVVVCATRVGLAADLGDDYCITGNVGDSSSLASKVVSTLHDDYCFSRLRSNGRQWSESHDVKWTVAEYRKIYETL